MSNNTEPPATPENKGEVKKPKPEKPEDYSSLHEAAEYGDLAAIRFWVNKSQQEKKQEDTKGIVNERGDRGRTPMYFAATEGHLEAVKLLHDEYGADPMIKTETGMTPAFPAAFDGHNDILKYFHSIGVDFNTIDEEDGPAGLPIVAAQEDQGDTLELLHSLGVDLGAASKVTGTTPAFIAAARGCPKALKALHSLGFDVNKPHPEGNIPITIHASHADGIEMVDLLLSFGGDVNIRDKWQETPLYHASARGLTEMVRFLHSKGADVNAACETGATPVYIASQEGHLETVKLLHSLKADIAAQNENADTPVYIAAVAGHIELVEWFLSPDGGGLDITTMNEPGENLIYAAVRGGKRDCKNRFELAKKLHAKGVDANQRSQYEDTPLLQSAILGDVPMAELLLKELGAEKSLNMVNDGGATPVFMACQEGHLEMVKFLHSMKADINKLSKAGAAPILIATAEGFVDIVKFIVSTGEVDVHAVTSGGHEETLVFLAAQNGHKELVEYFHSLGMDMEKPNKYGETPLFIAAWNGHRQIVRLLHESFGAKVDTESNDGFNPISVAAHQRRDEVVLDLHEMGADVNQKDKNGGTVIHILAELGSVEIIRTLHVRGNSGNGSLAELDLVDTQGWSPLMVAAYKGKGEVIELLHSFRADPCRSDSSGSTAAYLAAQQGHLEALKTLSSLKMPGGKNVDVKAARVGDGVTPETIAAQNGHDDVVAFLQSL